MQPTGSARAARPGWIRARRRWEVCVSSELDRVQQLVASGDLGAAEAVCASAGLAEGWRLVSVAYGRRGAKEASLAAVERGLAVGSTAKLHYQRGVALESLGRAADALAAYTAATVADPTHAWAWVNRGRHEDDAGRHADALASYDRALALDDKDEICWSNRGNSALALGRFADALVSFDRALALADTPQARLGRASTLVELGRIEEANATNPAGTPFDRGVAFEVAEALPDGRRLAVRYRTERHSRPEWLRAEAEAVARQIAPRVGHPAGSAPRVRVPYLFVPFEIRDDGDVLVVCAPDLRAPARSQGIVTFALQALVMARLLHDMVAVGVTPASWFDTIDVQPGALRSRAVVARRHHPSAGGRSGWSVVAEGVDADPAAFEATPIASLLRLRPELAKPITLPVGWTVRFDGHAVVGVTDDRGAERWR
jgi:Flp pilus assembly protein TadD